MKKINNKGFTLIELLVVIAIIGVLSTMAIINVRAAQEKARDTKRVTAVSSIRTAVEMYIADNGHPSLVIAPEAGSWSNDPVVADSLGELIGEYIQGGMPVDPIESQAICYCAFNQDYVLIVAAEAGSKKFDGGLTGQISIGPGNTYTAAAYGDCLCSDDTLPTGLVCDNFDDNTDGDANVGGFLDRAGFTAVGAPTTDEVSTYCIGTSI